MKDLIKVETKVIGEEEVNAIDAKGLHKFLEVKTHYSTWMARQINKYGFVVNSDFSVLETEVVAGGDKRKDYILSIDMAKELSMVENSPKGKEARKYFIQCEKDLKSGSAISSDKTITPSVADTMEATLRIAKLFGLKDNQAILSANISVRKALGVDCMASLEITHLVSEDQKQYFTPTVIGKDIGLSAIKVNQGLEKAGFQTKKRDHKDKIIWTVTDIGMKYAQIVDTNKKRSDGTCVQQIKWSGDVGKYLR